MLRIVVALLVVTYFTPDLVKIGDLQDFSDILENRVRHLRLKADDLQST